jgi:hypothetical protein
VTVLLELLLYAFGVFQYCKDAMLYFLSIFIFFGRTPLFVILQLICGSTVFSNTQVLPTNRRTGCSVFSNTSGCANQWKKRYPVFSVSQVATVVKRLYNAVVQTANRRRNYVVFSNTYFRLCQPIGEE